MSALGTLENGALALGRVLQGMMRPLDAGDPGPIMKAFVADLGWTLPDPVPPALIGLKDSIAALSQKVGDLEHAVASNADDDALLAAAAEVIAALVQAVNAITGLPAALTAQLPPAFVAATNFPNLFVGRLLGSLIVDGLKEALPLETRIARLLGIIEISDQPADPAHFQPAFELRAVHFERLGTLFSDPVQLMKDVYGWGTPSINLAPLHDALFSLSFALGFPGAYDFPTPGMLKAIAPSVANPKPDRSFELTIFDYGVVKATALITTVPKASPGEIQGIAIAIVTTGSLDKLEIPISGNLALDFSASIDASAGVAMILKPGQTPQLIANYDVSGSPVTSGELTATITYSVPDTDDPFTILALPGGSGITARQASFLSGLGRTGKGDLDPKFEVGLKKGKLSITMGGADGFLSKILPGDGINLDFDLTVGWSRDTGVYIQGNAGLNIAIPLHVDLGPLSLEWLYLDLELGGGGLTLIPSIGATGQLGPLSAAVDHIGIQIVTTFPPNGGNLGPANVDLGFKPPNGVGLSIDAGVVAGGGFLYIDTQHGEYAGALQLMFADFLTLTAIGLITTKMPDGSGGFSLLIIITAEFGAGIQLGFGFTLLAVGGLIGLNRTMLFQPLMDGVRSGAIDSVMFPQDVVKNAMKIISDLKAIFPPQEGTFLIGPMAKLGWGEPTLISLSLGVIIEIPPGDIAILGVLKLALPAEDVAVLLIQVNFAGALEFDKSRLYFFASLYDSRVLFITIEGEMGVLMAWGNDSNFVVSVGGFHPQFSPPPLPFPSPKRISVDILNESYARIHCDGYFAVTSNTCQFGSHADYFFGFSACSVEGHSGFDALLQFSPFHFTVEVSTSFSVKVFGVGVYGIGIDLTVEGPTPWHAHGTASLSFFFFSVDIGIDFTWGDSRNTMLPPVQLMPVLSGEFSKQSNWRAVLPAGAHLMVVLRKLDPSEAAMVLHPVGTLQVSQRLLPLDLKLDKAGNQAPSDANRFSLSVASPSLVALRTLQEQFAVAQFENLSDAQKLSQAAYSPLDGGVELAAKGLYASGTAISDNVRYDLTIIDTKFRRLSRRFFVLVGSLFTHFLNGSSVARSPMSAYQQAKTQPWPDKVALSPEGFAVALVADNTVYHPEAASFTSQAAANDYLARAVVKDPNLAGNVHVIPHFEVAA